MNFKEYITESENSENHETALAFAFLNKKLPQKLPDWMIKLGIIPGSKVKKAIRVGGSGEKTDVLIELEEGSPLKISAKLSNAAYLGNWYSKNRAIADFGEAVIEPFSEETLSFVQRYNSPYELPYVGVSLSFGNRSGQTGIQLTDFLSTGSIKNIVSGKSKNELGNANCLYRITEIPEDLTMVINNLVPITDAMIKALASKIFLIFRPVYPKNSFSDRGKQSWVNMVANKNYIKAPKIISTQVELLKVAHWELLPKEVVINHNGIINELKSNGIILDIKPKTY